MPSFSHAQKKGKRDGRYLHRQWGSNPTPMLKQRGVQPERARIIWVKDESLRELENLPPPDILAAEIMENLEDAV